MDFIEVLRLLLKICAIYFVLANITYFGLLILSWLELRKREANLPVQKSKHQGILSTETAPQVTVIIPAHNEVNIITESVSSYLSVHYSNFEVLVIDDGSTDRTVEGLIDAFHFEPASREKIGALSSVEILEIRRSKKDSRLWLIRQRNHGKATALNTGLDFAPGEFCCTADADTIPEMDCLLHLVGAFQDPQHYIVATGGTVRIANGAHYAQHQIQHGELPKSPLLVFQIVEYIRSFYCGRSGWEWVRSTVLLSGAMAAFRVSALKTIGGFEKSSITEDLEVIMNLRWQSLAAQNNWSVRLLHEPLCWTQAPSTIRDLRRQRVRWQQGLAQTVWKYFSLILNPSYGPAGFLHLPYILMFEWIGPWIELIAYFTVTAGLLIGILDPIAVSVILVAGVFYSTMVSLLSIYLEESRFSRHPTAEAKRRFFFAALLENFGYRQLTLLFRLEGMLRLLFKKNQSWGEQPRQSVSQSQKNEKAA